MNKLIVFVLTLISSLTFAQEINQFDANGKRHGIWKKDFDDTKVIRYNGEFNHGKEIGTFNFYSNIKGKPVLTVTKTFNTNNDLAEVKFYSSSKQVMSEGKMRGKIYIGKWVYYHNKSKVIMTEEFYNNKGELEGERKIFYVNGQLAQHENYQSGKLQGETKWFSEAGKTIRIFNYLNGELHGNAKVYDAKGNVEQEGVYQKDRRHGIWKFYQNGKLIKEKDFTRRSKNPYNKK